MIVDTNWEGGTRTLPYDNRKEKGKGKEKDFMV